MKHQREDWNAEYAEQDRVAEPEENVFVPNQPNRQIEKQSSQGSSNTANNLPRTFDAVASEHGEDNRQHNVPTKLLFLCRNNARSRLARSRCEPCDRSCALVRQRYFITYATIEIEATRKNATKMSSFLTSTLRRIRQQLLRKLEHEYLIPSANRAKKSVTSPVHSKLGKKASVATYVMTKVRRKYTRQN